MTLPVALVTLIAGLTPAVVAAPLPPAAALAAVQDRDPNTCAARAEWLGETQLLVRRDGVVPLTLFTAVGSGAGSQCALGISLSAVFFDRDGAVVCSGPVGLAPRHGGAFTYTNLELQPGNLFEFMRWVNGPRTISQQWARVTCASADGQTEAQATDLARIQSLRLHAVAPGNTGIGVAELHVILQP